MHQMMETRVCVTDLDGREVLIELRVQWGQLINGAVESAVVVTQDLAQEEGGKRYIYNNSLCKQASVTRWRWRQTLSIVRFFPLSASMYLVNGFSQHLPHKLKQLQVVLVNVGRRWRIKPFISTGGLQKFNRADRNLLASFICCLSCWFLWPPGFILVYLEQVECRIKHLLNDLLQKLFEHTVLVDTCLIHSQIIDKFHTNDAFYGICRQSAKLVIAILRTANTSVIVGQGLKTVYHVW